MSKMLEILFYNHKENKKEKERNVKDVHAWASVTVHIFGDL